MRGPENTRPWTEVNVAEAVVRQSKGVSICRPMLEYITGAEGRGPGGKPEKMWQRYLGQEVKLVRDTNRWTIHTPLEFGVRTAV